MSEGPVDQSGSTGDRRPDGTFIAGHRWSWKPGESGNAKGRPPGLLRALRRALAEMEDQDDIGKREEALARTLLSKALDGDMKAMEIILDRHEGAVLKEKKVELIERPIRMVDVSRNGNGRA